MREATIKGAWLGLAVLTGCVAINPVPYSTAILIPAYPDLHIKKAECKPCVEELDVVYNKCLPTFGYCANREKANEKIQK